MNASARRARLVLVLWLALGTACALRGPGGARLAHVPDPGDPTGRASLRLVLDGLDADVRGDSQRALASYERALQIDASNPYAYLALARFYSEQGDAGRTLSTVDQAAVLFESLDLLTPGVETHLIGLRGSALLRDGRRREGEPLLIEAARRAPDVWGDGELSAAELR